jgi:hypothetical protein
LTRSMANNISEEELKNRSLEAWKKVLNLVFDGYSVTIDPDEGMDNSYTLYIENSEKEDFGHTHCGKYVDVVNSETIKELVDQLIGDILHDRPGLAWYKNKKQKK